MTKKLSLAFLSLICLLCLVGCSLSNEKTQSTTKQILTTKNADLNKTTVTKNNPHVTTKGTVPIYEGMYVVEEATIPSYNDSNNGDDFEEPLPPEFGPRDEEDGEEHLPPAENKPNEDIEEMIDIEVDVDDEVKYYVEKSETFIIMVKISNPSNYEIQSFTLNGQKYSNYMFEYGSDMEHLFLKVKSPDKSGYFGYSIDAIKYIDGVEIKDVDLSKGEKSITVGVLFEEQPFVHINNMQINTTSMLLDIDFNDDNLLTNNSDVKFYLSDGETIVAEKDLQIGNNHLSFENLLMNKQYQYAIMTSYDLCDGNNEQPHTLIKDSFITSNDYLFNNILIYQDQVSFELEALEGISNVSYISIYDEEDDNSLVFKLDNLEERTFTNLLSDHNYILYVEFTYNLDSGEHLSYNYYFVKTLSKQAPFVEINNVLATETTVEFSISTTDIDNILTINSIELYRGSELIKDFNQEELLASNLLSNNKYKIKITYEYDLNDGDGAHTEVVSKEISTLPKSTPSLTITSTSSTQESITFDYNLVDEDKLATVTKIELYRNEVKEKELVDLSERSFTNLLSNNKYKIKITYEYDLNDGEGVHTEVVSKEINTLPKPEPLINFDELEVIDNSIKYKVDSVYEKTVINKNTNDIIELNFVSNYDYNGDPHLSYVWMRFPVENLSAKKLKLIVEPDGFDYYINIYAINAFDNYNFADCYDTLNNCDMVDCFGGYTLPTNDIQIIEMDLHGDDINYIIIEFYDSMSFGAFLKVLSILVETESETLQFINNIETIYCQDEYDYFYNLNGCNSSASPYENYYYEYPEIIYDTLSDEKMNISFQSELYLNDTLVQNIENSEGTFANLLNNNNYVLKIKMLYDLNDGNGIQTKEVLKEVHTPSKSTPSLTITNTSSTQESITFDYNLVDEDKLATVTKIELYRNEVKEKELVDLSERSFTNLLSNNKYKIKITYEYDLNDGKGLQTKTTEKEYVTLLNEVTISNIILLNSNVVKSGEEINLRIFFDNESEVEYSNIYVNGQKVNVIGGDRVNTAIVKFIPTDTGLVNFYVDKVDYYLYGIEVSQLISSTVHVTYPIYTDLSDIVFVPLTAGWYEYTGGGIYFRFNNDKGYTIYKVNNNSDIIVKISENEYYVDASSITSIEYGYDSFGTTNQTFDIRYSSHNINGYSTISTPEEFLSMNGNNMYILLNDIDLSQTPISSAINFSGILVGNGHKVSNLTYVVDTSNTEYVNIFGSASLYDVVFNSIFINVTSSSSYANILPFGYATLYNCKVTGDVLGSGNVTYGGIYNKDNSSSINISKTINDVYNQIKTTGQTIEKNNSVVIDNGFIYSVINNHKALMGSYDNSIQEYQTTDEIWYINAYAFSMNNSLTSYEDYKNVYYQHGFRLNGELLLTNFVGPNDILIYCHKESLQTVILTSGQSVSSYEFRNCQNLTSITIGNSVTNLGQYVFEDCINLNNITIGNSVTSIGGSAFSGCESLTSIIIPNSVTSIGNSAFKNCTSLTSIVIPNRVTNLGQYVFEDCINLNSITIGNSVTSIGDTAFYNCTSLTSITIPNNVTSIGNSAFKNCTSLTSIVIPNSVTSIGNSAFSGCTSLTTITIGNSVTSIGDVAFIDCKSLTNITIPGSVTSIGRSAFSGCESLTSIIIPNSVTSIGNSAFVGCESLTNIVIPESVTSIGEDAFWATSLQNVYYDGTTATWLSINFAGNGSNPLSYASNFYVLDENGDVEYNGQKYSKVTP